MKIIIGTSGWNYKHWKGDFYPEEIKQKDWFGHYLKKFNSVEINYSFYRWPSEKTLENWNNVSTEDFCFTMKAPRMITHVKKLNDVKKLVNDFYNLTNKLKDKIGMHLFQMPGSFKYTKDNFEKVKKFLDELDNEKENVIEFRETGWWNKEVFNLFKEKKVTFCSVSGFGMPEEIVKTTNTIYIRFHGANYSGNYSDEQLRKWAKKIVESKAKKTYIYFNNDLGGFAPKNALSLLKELEK